MDWKNLVILLLRAVTFGFSAYVASGGDIVATVAAAGAGATTVTGSYVEKK